MIHYMSPHVYHVRMSIAESDIDIFYTFGFVYLIKLDI